MTAIAMRCIKAEKHPNADALNIYQFVCPQKTDPVQIVANLENTYLVGEVATIALAGSILKDDTKIRTTKIRGVASHGMALGKTGAAEGTDLTEEYCLPEMAISFIPWPSIEYLFNVRRDLHNQGLKKVIKYRGKCKADGTCAGVQLTPSDFDGAKIVPESHTRIISVEEDNQGFASWLIPRYNFFINVRKNADSLGIKENITIFGEFCGLGLQRRCAISKINKKILAIFAIQIGTIDGKLVTDPEDIKKILGGTHEDIYIIPWYKEPIILDFRGKDQLERAVETINKMVEDIERCDPWVKETFGIEGLGEGVVMYPVYDILEKTDIVNKQDYIDLFFKAKGEKHKVVNSKKPAQLEPEFVSTINEFVELFCTENRLEQIANKVGGFDMKFVGEFLKEFCIDVQKESEAELEAADLQWKQVSKAIMEKSRKWYINKCKK